MRRNTIVARLFALLLAVLAIGGMSAPARAQMSAPLERAMAKMMQANSYHFDMTETTTAGVMKATGDVASFSPMKMKMAMDGGPEGAMQMVVLPTGAYMKIGSAAWSTVPGAEQMYSQLDVVGMMRKQAADTTVTDIGMKSVDGTMLHGYHVVNRKTSTQSTIYLDRAGNMARVVAGSMMMRFSNFGAPVSIVAPM